MTPEETAQKVFDEWLEASRGDMVLEKARKLKTVISSTIKQARNEAIEQILELVYTLYNDGDLTLDNAYEQIRKLKS